MIRCSSLPLLTKCPASGVPAAVSLNSYDPTATSGTDIHRAIALTLQGYTVPWNLSAADEDAVELGIDWVNNWLKPTYSHITHWLHELGIMRPQWPISGTLDLVGLSTTVDSEEAVVVDFKSTFRDGDHHDQLMGYTWLLFQDIPTLVKVTIIIPMIRLGKAAAPVEISREHADSWMDDLYRNVLAHPENYSPGEHCTRCRRRLECPALKQIVRATSDQLASPTFEKTLSRETLPAMRTRIKLIKEAIALFEGWQKETVLENGPIDLGDGKSLQAVEEQHDEIKLLPAWETLQSMFTDQEISEFASISKTAMLDILSAKYMRGTKKKACQAFMQKLQAAGAIDTKTVIKIKEVNNG